MEIDNERATYWLERGAQPSDAVRKLLEISGALEARPVKARAAVHVVGVEAQQAAADEAPAAEETPAVEEAPEASEALAEVAAAEVAVEEAPATGEVHVVGEEAQLEAEAADEHADSAEATSAEATSVEDEDEEQA